MSTALHRRPLGSLQTRLLVAIACTLAGPGLAAAQSTPSPESTKKAEAAKHSSATTPASSAPTATKPAAKAADDAPQRSTKTPTPASDAKAGSTKDKIKVSDKGKQPAASGKSESTSATARPQPPTADPAKDPEYPFMGEFVGPVISGSSVYQRLAVQVRPLAEGGFEALQYQGGLPGEPLHRPTPLKLVGKRWEKFLVLSGGPFAIFVEPQQCLVLDQQGQRVGRLERVHRQSPTLGARPPKDALILFQGKDTNQFTVAQVTQDGLLMEGAELKALFNDFNLHAEFQLPYMPAARDQGRSNSGLYLQSRYEVQVLDSFGEEPVFNGCGALYKTRKPDLNMCLPPLVWQTYDIAFTSPRWLADGSKWKNARITVWLNGVKVHDNVELADKTGAGKDEDPVPLPIKLQDHRNPVRFRNIWIVDRGALAPVDFPVLAKNLSQDYQSQVARPGQPDLPTGSGTGSKTAEEPATKPATGARPANPRRQAAEGEKASPRKPRQAAPTAKPAEAQK